MNSSERPTTMKMKAIPNNSEPTKCAALGPKRGVIAAVAAASAMTPKTTSKPATSDVVVSSSFERVRRRSPSSRVRANISCGSGASCG